MVIAIVMNECAERPGGRWHVEDVYHHRSGPGEALYAADVSMYLDCWLDPWLIVGSIAACFVKVGDRIWHMIVSTSILIRT
jgi:hypothetical protein